MATIKWHSFTINAFLQTVIDNYNNQATKWLGIGGWLTLGKPDSSHSLIMAIKSIDLAAMNSARKADMTEFKSKALEER